MLIKIISFIEYCIDNNPLSRKNIYRTTSGKNETYFKDLDKWKNHKKK